jgi:predicted amidohydrolase
LTVLAAAAGAKLVVFPEKFLSGYEPDLIAGNPAKYAFDANDARLEPIRNICRQRGEAPHAIRYNEAHYPPGDSL